MARQNKNTFTEEQKEKFLRRSWRYTHLYKIKKRDNVLDFFRPNKAQIDFIKNRHDFSLILKSRRLGFTTFGVVDGMDRVLCPPKYGPVDVLLITQTQDEMSKQFDQKVKLLWEHYPFKMLFSTETDKSNMLKFGHGVKKGAQGQEFSSFSVGLTGRGSAYSYLWISEFGKICATDPEKAREIISGAIPAVPMGGLVTIESTAEGNEGYFYDMFWNSWNLPPSHKYGPREFKAFFYNWRWDEEEINKLPLDNLLPVKELPSFFQEQQQKHNLSNLETNYYYQCWLGCARDYSLLKREYPTTPEEAFENSIDRYFDPINLEWQLSHINQNPTLQNSWRIFKPPVPSHSYGIGADPSEGVGKDHAAAVIIDFSLPTPEVVATFADQNTPPDMFAYELRTMAERYYNAFIIVERNNTGHATLVKLRDIYPHHLIYKEIKQTTDLDKETDRFGWSTNISTKVLMASDLNTAINEHAIILHDPIIYREADSYPKQQVQQVRMKQDQTNHWDLLVALMLAFQARHHVKRSTLIKTYIAPEDTKWYNTNQNNINNINNINEELIYIPLSENQPQNRFSAI